MAHIMEYLRQDDTLKIRVQNGISSLGVLAGGAGAIRWPKFGTTLVTKEVWDLSLGQLSLLNCRTVIGQDPRDTAFLTEGFSRPLSGSFSRSTTGLLTEFNQPLIRYST